MPVGCERPGVPAQSPERTMVGWVAGGRARRCGTFWRVALGITQTLCQQHSAAGDDQGEQGQHVHRHAGERLSLRRFWPDGGWNDEITFLDRRSCPPPASQREPGGTGRVEIAPVAISVLVT
jgi:hypothetical protein